MRHSLLNNLVLIVFVFCGVIGAEARVVKVACVGGGNTLGVKVVGGERNSYPSYLGYLLGDGYEVRNFGLEGGALFGKGAYENTEMMRKVTRYRADVVVFDFGGSGEQGGAVFIEKYRELIEKLGKRSEVIVCLPTKGELRGDVRKLVKSTRTQVVDLSVLNKDKSYFVGGGLLGNFGSAQMAREVYEKIIRGVDTKFDVFKELDVSGDKVGDFQGYEMRSFTRGGLQCRVVKPRVAVKGRHWIWRARFFGHEPQFDKAMLDRGWHVVYVEVGGLFGGPEAVRHWDVFYKMLTDAGLSDKPVLEGMSRGGMIIYNWAKQNPEKVAGIYGDNPVCDGRSWPGGKGEGKGSTGDWTQCMKIYGIDEKSAKNFKGFPIDGLERLAKAKVPLFHVVGSADSVVPVKENTDVLQKNYEALGGKIEVIRKAGLDHHPHSLKDPKPLIDFAIRCVGERVNYSVLAVPSVEYRGGPAGWGGGTWWGQFEHIQKMVDKTPKTKLVLLGDSITQNWTGWENRVAKVSGRRAIDRFYGKYQAIGMGISGDRTEHLLYRIKSGNFDKIKPKAVVLMIGVNDILKGRLGEDIAAGIHAVVKSLRKKLPRTKILALGCFPTGKDKTSWNRRQSEIIHEEIKAIGDGKYVIYKDLRGLFLKADGSLDYNVMSRDNVHLTGKAYDVWGKGMATELGEMLGD